MLRAFKYRLEPNANQARELEITLETHRRLYNACLQQRKASYETSRKSVQYADQSAWFKAERKTNPFYARLNFSSAQATMRRLDKAFQAFFRRVKRREKPGYPRFKARDRFASFTYPLMGDGARMIGRKLRLQHVGLVRINLHRPLEGTPKMITVLREGGHWFAVVCCEVTLQATPSTLPMVGLDVGLEHFVTTSNNERLSPLQPLKGKLKQLRVEQRSLSRKKKGSQSRAKQRQRVARLHTKVRNYRRDQHHKIAHQLVQRYGYFVVESLKISNLVRNHRLARAILDAAWRQFFEILRHHAEGAGGEVYDRDPRRSSQECPACGAEVQKALRIRLHRCSCGYVTHRDHAAAQVILSRGPAGSQPEDLNVGAVVPHGLRSRLL